MLSYFGKLKVNANGVIEGLETDHVDDDDDDDEEEGEDEDYDEDESIKHAEKVHRALTAAMIK
jgi:hypothetical protein